MNIKLQQLCPSLQVGDIVTLNFLTTSNSASKNSIYLSGANILWNKGDAKTITEEMLDSIIAFYGGHEETAIINEFMIRLADTTDTYEPYVGGQPSPSLLYPQPIKSVVGEIKNKIQNGNLFDENYYNNSSLYDNQIYFAYVKMPDTFKTKFYGNMSLKGTSQSLVFGFSDSNISISNRMLSGGNINNNVEYDFTNAENVYLIIGNSNQINIQRDIPLIFDNYNIMISKETATPYVPHAEQNLPFTLEQGQKLFAGDTLEDDGKHHKRKQKIFDGNENWYQYGSNIALIDWDDKLTPQHDDSILQGYLCNIATETTNNSQTRNDNTFVTYHKTVTDWIVFHINMSVTEWKEHLAEQYANGTPVKIVYKTATEQIVPYNSTQQTQYNAIKKARTYNDVTYIESTSDELPPILEVQYWKKKDAEVITPQENENKVEFVDELPDNENSYNLDKIENLMNPIEVESEVIEDETNN